MRWYFHIFLIAVLAMALGVFARTDWGYVHITAPDVFSREMSLSFFTILLSGTFLFFYILLRASELLWDLPHYCREKRQQKRREQMEQMPQKQNEVMLALWREDYPGVQKAIEELINVDTPDMDGVTILLIVQAALRTGDDVTLRRLLRDPVLNEAAYEIPRVVVEAEWLLQKQRTEEALTLLKELRTKTGVHTSSGRLELQALQTMQQHEAMISLLDSLQRGGKISEAEALSWRCREGKKDAEEKEEEIVEEKEIVEEEEVVEEKVGEIVEEEVEEVVEEIVGKKEEEIVEAKEEEIQNPA